MSTNLTKKIIAITDDFCADDNGRSVSVYHPDIGLQHRNGDTPHPIASIAKVPLAIALYDAANQGDIDLLYQISLSILPATRYISILAAFDTDRCLSLRELIALMLMTSDNPVTVYLMELLGFDRLNGTLRRVTENQALTLSAGFTEDELGLPNRANMMTANDVVKLFQSVKNEPLYADIETALANNLRNQRIPALLPETARVAHKTGTLNGVVNDAGIISDGPINFTVVFLCDGQNDMTATTSDIAVCAKQLYDVFLNAANHRP